MLTEFIKKLIKFNMNKSFKLTSGIFSLILVFLLVFAFSAFSGRSIEAADEADTIAVRIVPNPNHYSISRWYESQGFFGSPQALSVDGYEAIRDGRTVYVNAANVSGNSIYTNIYMISYSQEPSEKTVDILGQIVSHWSFNDGLKDESSASCSISALSCETDSDCANGQSCSTLGLSSGSCVLKEVKNCSIDEDCPSGFFCDSKKAIITRDIKRLGRLEEMRNALADYRDNNGRFPVLSAGTYLPNKSVSLWPSWQQNFLADLAMSPSYIDPINRLGYCPGFDKETCWNKDTKAFVYNPENNKLTLPDGSYAFLYSSFDNGVDYNLCAVLETKSIGYNFNPGYSSDSACVTGTGISTTGNANNTAPELVDSYLVGQKDKEFNGFIKVTDADNDNLTWSIVSNNNSWSSWSAAPILLDTSNKFQKKVYAGKAGAAGIYSITVKVDDGRRGVSYFDLNIEIAEPGIFIEANNSSHVLDKDIPFEYSFYVSGENLPNPLRQSNVLVQKVSGPANISTAFFKSEAEPILVSNNRYKITYKGEISPEQYQIPEDTELGFEITVTDKNGKQGKKRFEIKIISEKPAVNFSCPLVSRKGYDYNCFLGSLKQFNHDISFSAIGVLPNSLKVENKTDGSAEAYLLGRAYTSSGAGYGNSGTNNSLITLRATNEYGAYNEKQFTLKINTFCGDGTKQGPNDEGKGGPYNDGYEDCDGMQGIASSPSNSGPDRQYKCATMGGNIPYEINSNTYCVFAYPLDGGGYCGDDFCQTKNENKTTCAADCSDGSGGTVLASCSLDSDCSPGYYCNTADGACYLKTDFCSTDGECGVGYKCGSSKTCELKCWNVLETTETVEFRTGDITRSSTIKTCRADYIDNPSCYDFDGGTMEDFPGCPLACNNGYKYLGKTGSGDRCKDSSPWIGNDWHQRNRYLCWNSRSVQRCYGQLCRTTLSSTAMDGVMNAEGKCLKDAPIVQTTYDGPSGSGGHVPAEYEAQDIYMTN